MGGEGTEKHLIFALGNERYGVRLLSVREVVALPDITPIPQTPDHFLGIMNLRGQIISVMDLRKKLGMKAETNAETPVIVFMFGEMSLGVVVDAVESVISPEHDDISEKPEMQSQKQNEYIEKIYRRDGDLILFIDVKKALNVQDEASIKKMTMRS